MRLNKSRHRAIRLQNQIFTVLFLIVIGLLGWISNQQRFQFDWTAGGRNSLSSASEELLSRLDGPIKITAFAFEDKVLRTQIREMVDRYRRHKSDITFIFINPDQQPEKVRELGITMDGELIVEYQGRSERVQVASESALTNSLQRLARTEKRWVVFLSGHGERSPFGQANHDFENFGKALAKKGIIIQELNLVETPVVPDNVATLVIAGPQAELLDGEVRLIVDYVERGGNLLWLQDPGNLQGLYPLAEQLGIRLLTGTIVDATTQLLGIDDPSFALVSRYSAHPVTMNFQKLTLFPVAAALEQEEDASDFHIQPFLSTTESSWTERGTREGEIEFDVGTEEQQGPLDIGFALTRRVDAENGDADSANSPQRIIVIGDGDFLSNSYLGNGGNLDLGLNIVQWLNQDDQLVAIPATVAPDQSLTLSKTATLVIGFGFLFVMPALLIGIGAGIWVRRRKR